ncbi:ferredoxin [Streptosporangium amethystogenes subsp. fukuiense]|uniref:Ferredoxin n=1 Tax=Streptosporangium amethystogenes subsp. fukuiense TaxID=698418 RepID=A0ABW2T9K1_9ACTN
MRVQINSEKCQGHGRCYDLAPTLFTEDEEGYGQVIADGAVPQGDEHVAHLAVSNCPERAIDIVQEA